MVVRCVRCVRCKPTCCEHHLRFGLNPEPPLTIKAIVLAIWTNLSIPAAPAQFQPRNHQFRQT